MRNWCPIAAAILSMAIASGQSLVGDAVDAQRKSRAPKFTSDEAPTIERVIGRVAEQPVLGPLTNGIYGFRLKIGSPVVESGLALGPEYLTGTAGYGVMFRTSARLSVSGYQHYDAEFALPRLANDHVFLNVLATHRNYPRMPYYGQGPHTSLLNRTNFRLKDSTGELTAGVRPFRVLRIGATGGYMLVNTGAGTDQRHGFNSRAFVPAAAPGFGRESRFLTSGGFVHIDATDHPYSPKTGIDYRLRFSNFVDQTPGRGSFRQLDVDLRHYISFFQKQRSIVLRGYSVLTDTRRGHTVPFYLRPSLGGPETLRGFRPFRFYDNNLV